MSPPSYCGWQFSADELQIVRDLCASPALDTRAAVARAFCDQLGWYDAKDRPKLVSAHVLLSRMERDGLIRLPQPKRVKSSTSWPLHLPPSEHPTFDQPLSSLRPLELVPVTTTVLSRNWMELIARHHYLGYRPLVGAQRRYIVRAHGEVLCLFGFAAAAWACRPRDDFIGWNRTAREANLRLVVANVRFLVLPWVRVPNLASSALALVARRLPDDWMDLYGYRPLLLETFVESGRFAATCYRAANWIHVGQTQGRGKLDAHKWCPLPVKDVYCLPLAARFRRRLCSTSSS